ncbi:MAG: glutathione S-transferase family protein [Leptospira sp.]|nr:glutathione S-transferase family protein [Leptospira sp.]NCS92358.1 glutathione S-transferase family protein [Leptospira sp.]
MFKLHGFPTSNYYNKIKIALHEKDLPFEEIRVVPSQEEDFLKISPLGRIPILEYKGEYIRETHVMYEFLEEVAPDTLRLLPSDALTRVRVREISLMTDLYLDFSARPLFQHVFFAAEKPSEAAIEKALKDTLFGWRAISNLLDCENYAVGDQFSYADISAASTWDIVQKSILKMTGKDLWEDKPMIAEYLRKMEERPHIKATNKAQKAALRMAAMAKKKS